MGFWGGHSLIVMENAMMIMAHTSLCSRKNLRLSSSSAMIPMVMVAQAARNANADSSDPKTCDAARSPFPSRCHALVGGRCSGSRLAP